MVSRFGLGLLSTVGDMHKRQRRTISPVFSSSHMRDLTPMAYSIAKEVSMLAFFMHTYRRTNSCVIT